MTPADVPLPISLTIVTTFAWVNYGWFVKIANRLSRLIVDRLEPRDVPLLPAIGIGVLPSWFLVTTSAYVALALIVGLPLTSLITAGATPGAILGGLALGMSEASVTMMLATVFSRLLAPVRRQQKGGNPLLEHHILGQSGWMRTYQYPFRWLPRPLAVTLAALPLLGEELVFRAGAISLLAPMGVVGSVAISTLLFMVVQTRWLPTWYQAVGPVAGALVMGIGHGLLFALNQQLLPLLIAHITFFMMIAIGRRP